MADRELLMKDEVYAVVGAAMDVHRELRSGFLEAVYQEAMEVELTARRVPFARQVPIPIYYKGQALEKKYIADLICYGQVLVELKHIDQLTGLEEAQLLNYMHALRFRVGLLINFGDPGRLDWQRYVL